MSEERINANGVFRNNINEEINYISSRKHSNEQVSSSEISSKIARVDETVGSHELIVSNGKLFDEPCQSIHIPAILDGLQMLPRKLKLKPYEELDKKTNDLRVCPDRGLQITAKSISDLRMELDSPDSLSTSKSRIIQNHVLRQNLNREARNGNKAEPAA